MGIRITYNKEWRRGIMGVYYLLRCETCYEQVEDFEYETMDEYDEEWEKRYEKLDPDFGLSWGKVNPERLIKWVNEHKEHGKIEFTGE